MSTANSTAKSPKVVIGPTWEAIGPFPSGMREHPLTSGPQHAFSNRPHKDPDISLARSEYGSTSWPSELAFGGEVGWSLFTMGKDGWTEVSYDHIDWSQLRSDHGWASLQYQCVLRNTITVPTTSKAAHDSSSTFDSQTVGTPLLVDAIQCVEYAFIPFEDNATAGSVGPVTWYQGDIYNYAESTSGSSHRSDQSSNYARSISLQPGKYTVLVRALYEIRMFGDPGIDKAPVIRFKLGVDVDEAEVEMIPGLDVLPDVVDGVIAGHWAGIGLRVSSSAGPVTVVEAYATSAGDTGEASEAMDERGEGSGVRIANLLQPVRLQSGQTGVLPLKVDHSQVHSSHVEVTIVYDTQGRRQTIQRNVHLDKTHLHPGRSFKMAFASPMPSLTPAQVSHAVVLPPPTQLGDESVSKHPVILALHGAGVNVDWPLWQDAMPECRGWAVLPTGKNEWGEDWHGASMGDAWAARDALGDLAEVLGLEVPETTFLIGHSNGGQGAWHLAARYPDRIVGVIAAAGYTKIQGYVPYTSSVSRHYADPALMGILDSALSPYNNDLHLSNLVGIPCLALHGSADDNVTPRHSRLQAGIVDAWQAKRGHVEVVEVKGKGHWWEGLLREPRVAEFIERVMRAPKRKWDDERNMGFTLTAANPDESGGRAGIKIVEVETPGRIARLDVNAPHWRNSANGTTAPVALDLRGMNVKRIEVVADAQDTRVQMTWSNRQWEITSQEERPELNNSYTVTTPRPYGPMIRFLASPGPIVMVIGSKDLHRDLAIRIAHDLFVNHRIRVNIISAAAGLEAVAKETLSTSNIAVIGCPTDNMFAKWLFAQRQIPVSFPTKGLMEIEGRLIYEAGAGLISLHPHPISATALAMVIAGNDNQGLETAARLFPIRTGVTVPDWVAVGPRMSWQGAGGMIGAGFWSGDWRWNEAMSWIDR